MRIIGPSVSISRTIELTTVNILSGYSATQCEEAEQRFGTFRFI